MAEMSVQSSQEKSALQQALLESAQLFTRDVLRFAHDWQVRWADPAMTRELAEISEALLIPLASLEREFSRPEGPLPQQVARALGLLLGMPDAPGPLTRLQALPGDDAAAMSLEDQRLLSEADTLFIQLNGFRAQWQDYLSLVTALERGQTRQRAGPVLPPLPPNRQNLITSVVPPLPRRQPFLPDTDANGLPALETAAPKLGSQPPAAWQGGGQRPGLGMLKALLPVLLALVVIIFLAYQVASRIPKAGGQATPVPAATSPRLATPPATAAIPPTSTGAAAPTATPPAQPSPTAPPQPTATPPAGAAQLSVNPPVLTLPCPGTGAATLQLANTGAAPLDWIATASGASGEAAGILLDGASSERGHLDSGAVAQISVTAQTATAQGTITITAAGAAPVTVSYSVSC